MSELVDCFARLCRDQPARPLVHLPADRRTWTADDLRTRVHETRRAFARAGISRDMLLVARPVDAPTTLAVLAASRAEGAVLALCDRTMPAAELEALCARYGAGASIVGGEVPPDGYARVETPLPGGHRLQRLEPSADALPRRADLAMLKLTSGSTGVPRAVGVTDAQLVADTRRIAATVGIHPDTVQMALTPLSHAYGLGNLAVPVLLQGTPIVRRESFVPHRFVEDARAYDATMFPGVPFMFEHLAELVRPGTWPPTLVRLMSAGAPLSAATVEACHANFGVKVRSFYGTSESGFVACDTGDGIGGLVTQGHPAPGVTVTLVDDEAGASGAGRLHVASDAVGCGYVGEDVPEFSDGRFLTGDIGAFDADGRIVLTGRVSAFVNVAGRKVDPAEVEGVLRAVAAVRDVRVFGAPDNRRGERLVACIVRAVPDVGIVELRRMLAGRLAPHKIPQAWVFLDRIPVTERGKTDRQRLYALAMAQADEEPAAP